MAIETVLKSHPRKTLIELHSFVSCIEACIQCAETCTSCADACLAEERVQTLRKCIRLDLDCADICRTTARILTRQTEPEPQFMRILLDVCVTMCGLCARECETHAEMHRHCRICAEACRECERNSRQLLAELPGGAGLAH
ncbi:four-helix bundle copper-binding protein [Geobacter sp. SVR]|uniref:four-helix bundle copper-binding protein n=1 Tax=Geobacter sp. SVR TaxID=2495594 RepID=UPI00143F020B|nr:four-helix bundle copper-binding protein [Geobacter sp. SVR]BCS53882.1 hypothetical protein GSVR_21900 [Geobacter sp. SVR]GCF85609.1 hypothetical protein GSbR_22090 [Geobacter sp. SVR]